MKLIFFVLSLMALSGAEDLPCNAVLKDEGYICMCNATYCDTIEAPEKLPPRQFHIYTTSKLAPGFKHSIGIFKTQEQSTQGIKLKINDKIKRQTIRGFGGAFTDSSGFVLNKLSKDAQENLLKSYFSSEGVEYNLCRIVLGSSDFSLRDYSYVPNYDPTLQSFNLTVDDYYKIIPMKRAKLMSKRKIQFFGSTWGSPPWMKSNKKFTLGYISNKFRQTWAEYIVKVLDAFKKEGVDLWAITTGNEPVTLLAFPGVEISVVAMYPEDQRNWIAENLGPTLEKAGYKDLPIIAFDDNRLYALWFLDTVMKNKVASKYVSAIAIHWYMDPMCSPLMLDRIHEKYPNLEILYTESSINPFTNLNLAIQNKSGVELPTFTKVPPALGSWRRTTLYLTYIIEALNHWTSGFVDWNILLDTKGGPNLLNFTCDAMIIVNNTADEFYKQPYFYVIGHFSKFLHPGAVIVDVKPTSDEEQNILPTTKERAKHPADEFEPIFLYEDVRYVGGLNPDGSHSIIIYNPKVDPVEVSLQDENRGYAFVRMEPESLMTIHY